MIDPRKTLIEFVLSRVTGEPLNIRVSVLRALAEYVGTEAEATQLRRLAADLESADRRCREFAFQFSNPQPEGKR